MSFYLGVDPGKGGGLVVIDDTALVRFFARMPESVPEMVDVFSGIAMQFDPLIAGLEFVRSSPQMGVSSSFTFGRGLGHLEMSLAWAQIPYKEIHPIKWQNALGCRTRGDKNVTKDKATELFGEQPYLRITHALADAVLIAEYMRREYGGRLFDPSAIETDSNNGEEESESGETDPVARGKAPRIQTRVGRAAEK